jgi:hypothetical protein
VDTQLTGDISALLSIEFAHGRKQYTACFAVTNSEGAQLFVASVGILKFAGMLWIT